MFLLCNRNLQSPTSFKVINIRGCDECLTRRYVKTFNRDFKIQRRGRQQERQENRRFNKQNNNFARASRFFCRFLCPFLHDHDVKMPNFTFYGERKQATMKFCFPFCNWIWSLGGVGVLGLIFARYSVACVQTSPS